MRTGKKWLLAEIKPGLRLYLVLHPPSLTLCAQVHVARALVFGTKDCRLESSQVHACWQKVAAGGNQARAPFAPCASSTVFGLVCASACRTALPRCKGLYFSSEEPSPSSAARSSPAPGSSMCIETVLMHAPDNLLIIRWPCGLMDKALVFGTKDCRFEFCQGQSSSALTAEVGWSLG